MYRRLASRLIAATLAASVAGFLAACAEPDAPAAHHQVVIVGAVQGSPFVGPTQAQAVVDRFSNPGDRVTIIVPDGVPHVAADIELGSLPKNSFDAADELTRMRQQISSAIVSARADDPEADYAEAFGLAARAIMPGDGQTSIVVLGSGISTTGAMSMLEGRFDVAPEVLVDAAKSAGALPRFTQAVSVAFPRIAITAPPQPPLTSQAADRLISHWRAFLTEAGVEDISFEIVQLTSRPYAEAAMPSVTPLPVSRVDSECATSLDATEVRFTVGEATFDDRDAAERSIAEVAEKLASCRGQLNVEGSASSEGDYSANVILTQRRAEAVAALLADMANIPAADITITAWGPSWPCRIDDRDQDGELVESLAAANRVVVVSRGVDPGTC